TRVRFQPSGARLNLIAHTSRLHGEPFMRFATAACIVSAFLAASADTAADDNKPEARLYEMRVYTANPGKLDALNARFRDHTVQLFKKHGITNVGYFVPT